MPAFKVLSEFAEEDVDAVGLTKTMLGSLDVDDIVGVRCSLGLRCDVFG